MRCLNGWKDDIFRDSLCEQPVVSLAAVMTCQWDWSLKLLIDIVVHKPILSFEDGQYDLEINPGVDKKPHSVVKTDRQGSILPPL